MEEAKEYLNQKNYKKYLESIGNILKYEDTPENRSLYLTAKKMNESYEDVLNFRKKDKKDLYSILEIKRDASIDEIKSSYRKLVLKYHPDRSLIPETSEALQAIMEAYNVLVDEKKREEYDNSKNKKYNTNENFVSKNNDYDVFFGINNTINRNRFFYDEFDFSKFFYNQSDFSRFVYNQSDFYKFMYNIDDISIIKNMYRYKKHTENVKNEMDDLTLVKKIIAIFVLVLFLLIMN